MTDKGERCVHGRQGVAFCPHCPAPEQPSGQPDPVAMAIFEAVEPGQPIAAEQPSGEHGECGAAVWTGKRWVCPYHSPPQTVPAPSGEPPATVEPYLAEQVAAVIAEQDGKPPWKRVPPLAEQPSGGGATNTKTPPSPDGPCGECGRDIAEDEAVYVRKDYVCEDCARPENAERDDTTAGSDTEHTVTP